MKKMGIISLCGIMSISLSNAIWAGPQSEGMPAPYISLPNESINIIRISILLIIAIVIFLSVMKLKNKLKKNMVLTGVIMALLIGGGCFTFVCQLGTHGTLDKPRPVIVRIFDFSEW